MSYNKTSFIFNVCLKYVYVFVSADDFKSKTSPNKNYINEFVYDLKNNLVKIINNGKETLLKK